MPLAVLRKVLQGLEANIKGGQAGNIKDFDNRYDSLTLAMSLAAWGANPAVDIRLTKPLKHELTKLSSKL